MSAAEDATPPGAATPLDARGLLCPLPVIRVQDHMKGLAPGAVLEVLATDPGTLHDIPAWCRVHGHRVVATQAGDGDYRFRIAARVSRPDAAGSRSKPAGR